MADLTAANLARLDNVLDRTIRVDGLYTSWRHVIESGRVGARRHRTFSTGKHAYGLILTEDIDGDDLKRAPYYDAPKMILDYLDHLPLVRIIPEG